ncbi:MAG: SIS domain-containing protein [Anaerolineales bacterium]|nr:SIS domain-containing protein [Anaerolineales bacterium]
MYHIEQEINAQPAIIQNLLETHTELAQHIARSIHAFDPAFVLVAARGTSDNAARYAQYVLAIQAGLPVGLATPSVHTLYHAAPNLKRSLVIGISQSGRSEDVRRVVEDAKRQGGLTLGITNDADSPLAHTADYHIPLDCGEERSVAATKTYTAELSAIALLTAALTDKPELHADLAQLPAAIQQTIDYSATIPDWVQRYRYAERIASIGRGYNHCTAYEISLKIKELCYITGEEYSEADFRHGPIAVINPGFPVLVVAPQGQPLPLLIDLIEKLNDKGAECLVISNDSQVQSLARYALPMPSDVPEWLSPICAVIPGQVFAMHLALTKGYAVDTPRGLQKVTVTL